jgi:hypothetical protein
MTPKEALKEIKSLLFSEAEVSTEPVATEEVKLSLVESTLVDGTIVYYDLSTSEIWVAGANGEKVPAPVGEHELSTGEIVVVTEEGKIAEVKEVDTVPVEEMAKETPIDVTEKMTQFESDFATLSAKVEEMAKIISELSAKNEKMNKAVEMSAIVLETLAKDSSAEPIQKTNNFHKQLKDKSNKNFTQLQQVFQTLKTK